MTEIDAPEVFHPSCEAERIAGLRAKERVAGLIRGQSVELVRVGGDGPLRPDVRAADGAGEVGAILLREGLAVRYRPGRHEKEARTAHWCRGDRR